MTNSLQHLIYCSRAALEWQNGRHAGPTRAGQETIPLLPGAPGKKIMRSSCLGDGGRTGRGPLGGGTCQEVKIFILMRV